MGTLNSPVIAVVGLETISLSLSLQLQALD